MRSALEELEGRVVGGDHAGTRTRFDGHVADRHPAFHRQAADRVTAVLDDVTLAAAGADASDEAENQVLGAHAVSQVADDLDRHRLGSLQRQGLRGEHMLDLAGADAERERAERAVRARVAVSADDGHAGLGQTELRADDVDDALVGVAHRMQPDAELRAVLSQRLDLLAADRILDRTVSGGDVVVLSGDGEVRTSYDAVGRSQAVEGLWAGDLVDQVQVDVEQVGLVVGGAYGVCVPDLFRQSATHDDSSLDLRCSICVPHTETAVSPYGTE